MSKPRTHYLAPVPFSQLCVDIAFFDTPLGKTPKLLAIDTVNEFASIHDLPMDYQAEDIRDAIMDRLQADTLINVISQELVADPESAIGKAKNLFKSSSKYDHLHAQIVPTATHVALVENLIKKTRAKLVAIESQFEAAYSVKMPLYFVSAILRNTVTKINHISNQGTLSATAPAILRGEEPLDYKALIALKVGDLVLAYKREQDTNAVFVMVLDHDFGRHPSITAGFNMETQHNISAGKGKYAKWKRVNEYTQSIKDKLKHLRKKSMDEFNLASKRQTKAIKKLEQKLKDPKLTNEQRISIQRLLQQAPPMVPRQVDEAVLPVAPAAPIAPIQGGETQGGEGTQNEIISISINSGVSPTPIEAIPAVVPLEPTVPIPTVEPVVETTPTVPAPQSETGSRQLRPKKVVNYKTLAKEYKVLHVDYEIVNRMHGHVSIQKHNVRKSKKEKKADKVRVMKDFLIFHTSISQAAKENEELVHEAVSKEYDQLLRASEGDKKVLKLMKKSFNVKGKTIIPSLIFMKKKMNKATKEFEKWKARLVAGGHKQDPEIYTKNDITVPTLDHASLLMFLSVLMKRKGCRFYQMDFPGAFLKADLESEIYMQINKQNVNILRKSHPEIIDHIRDDGTLITRIQKALYGLKESGKLFRDKVVEIFKEFGLEPLANHNCIFQKKLPSGKFMYACLYVDDVIIGTNDVDQAEELRAHCDKDFPGIEILKDKAFSFLGMSIKFDYKNRIIRYNTSLYIEELCDKYEITKGHSMPHSANLMKHDPNVEVLNNPTKFKSLVMALFYIAKKTRPDILFTVAYLATESASPTHEHMAKAYMVLAYLYETKDIELTHNCNSSDPGGLYAFVDASYAIHKDMKGHTGALIFDELLNLFYSSSTKQKLMGKSSTDAEIIGAHATMNSIESLKALYSEMTGSSKPTVLFQDNLSAKFLMENGDSSSDKSKHMKIRYFYIKEKVDEKVVEVQYRNTERMWADLLTKPITNRKSFALMRSKIMNLQPGDKYYVSE